MIWPVSSTIARPTASVPSARLRRAEAAWRTSSWRANRPGSAAPGGAVRRIGRVAGAIARARRVAWEFPGRPWRADDCALMTPRSHAGARRPAARWYLGRSANVPPIDHRLEPADVRDGRRPEVPRDQCVEPPGWTAVPAGRGSLVGRSPRTTG